MSFSSDRGRMRLILRGVAVLMVAALAAVVVAGCATGDSEIPWNAPQSWEGSPAIPGLPTQ